MSLRRHALLLAATLPAAACSSPTSGPTESNQVGTPAADVAALPTPAAIDNPSANAAGDAAAPDDEQADYIGRWIGVEGMVLDIKANPRGGVKIDNQWDLDHRGNFDGSVTAEGLRWMRGDEAVTASPGDGAAAGLKYLAGKKHCLIVKNGEGYCRD